MYGGGYGGGYGPGMAGQMGMGPVGLSPYGYPWGAGAYGVSPFYNIGPIDDAEIASYVHDNIDLDPYISVRDKNSIDVEVSGGTVTLSGKVESRRSKGLAYADAFWAPGVLDVVNEVEVEEKPRPSAKEEMA
ncbi:MAG TPA: BON domain-containing protein [Clostridia bacterium]|nr:BON domain-containing protein [Clostridia bacterium]